MILQLTAICSNSESKENLELDHWLSLSTQNQNGGRAYPPIVEPKLNWLRNIPKVDNVLSSAAI